MPTTINDRLTNSFITLDTNLHRLSTTGSGEVLTTLKELEEDIVRQLTADKLSTSWSLSKYNSLLKEVQNEIKNRYTSVYTSSDEFLQETIIAQTEGFKKTFTDLGVPLIQSSFPDETLRALTSKSMIMGAPSKTWWTNQSTQLQDNFIRQMQIGYLSGENLEQLVARVRGIPTGRQSVVFTKSGIKGVDETLGGIMNTSYANATALVRTSIQQISNDGKMLLFQSNSDLIKAIQWISTLDNRTTQHCVARAGKLYTLKGEPIGHDLSFNAGPPAHYQCRSIVVPVLYSWTELGENPKLDEAYKSLFSDSAKAGMTGNIPKSPTYESWFGGLSESDKISYLGQNKYNLWKRTEIPFSAMIDQSGNPLTIGALLALYGVSVSDSELKKKQDIQIAVDTVNGETKTLPSSDIENEIKERVDEIVDDSLASTTFLSSAKEKEEFVENRLNDLSKKVLNREWIEELRSEFKQTNSVGIFLALQYILSETNEKPKNLEKEELEKLIGEVSKLPIHTDNNVNQILVFTK